jgi:putative transposase
LGLSGQVPRRVDAATKTGLLELLDEATDEGWSLRRTCRQLELGEVRVHRWLARRDRGDLIDAKPGGAPMHGLLDEEVEAIGSAQSLVDTLMCPGFGRVWFLESACS